MDGLSESASAVPEPTRVCFAISGTEISSIRIRQARKLGRLVLVQKAFAVEPGHHVFGREEHVRDRRPCGVAERNRMRPHDI